MNISKYLINVFSWLYFSVTVELNSVETKTTLSEFGEQKKRFEYDLRISKILKELLFGYYFFEIKVLKKHLYGYYEVLVEYSNNTIESYPIRVFRDDFVKRIILIQDNVKKITVCSTIPNNELSDIQINLKKVNDNYARKKIIRKINKKSDTVGSYLQQKNNVDLWSLYNNLFIGSLQKTNYNQWLQNVEPFMWVDNSDIKRRYNIVLFLYDDNHDIIMNLVSDLTNFTETIFTLHVINKSSGSFKDGLEVSFSIYNGLDEFKEYLLETNDNDYILLNSKQLQKVANHFFQELDYHLELSSQSKIVYFDEDIITDNGIRRSPCFKPDLNIELLFSHNYIGENCYLNKSVLLTAIDNQYSVPYFAFLSIAIQDPTAITHIPKVLFHIIHHSENNYLNQTFFNYFKKDDVECLKDFIRKKDISGTIKSGIINNSSYFEKSLPETKPLVSIIIPTRDCLDLLKVAVESIFDKTLYNNFELLIVNNQSLHKETHNYFENLKESNNKVKILEYPYEFNYSAINNFASQSALGDVLLFLNNDVKVINKGWLIELVRQVTDKKVGCVGAKLYYGNSQIQHGGVILGPKPVAGHAHRYYDSEAFGYMGRLKLVQNYMAVTGACLAIRKEVFEEVGRFNEKSLPVAYNDVDLCLKSIKAGYRNVWTPYAELYHFESLTRGKDVSVEKGSRHKKEIQYMQDNWSDLLINDKYYSLNFRKYSEDFSY